MDCYGIQMFENNKKNETYEIVEIFENVTIIYNDGIREVFDAIYQNNNAVYTGTILKINNHEVFVEGGGIPKNIIKNIEWKNKKKIYFKTDSHYKN